MSGTLDANHEQQGDAALDYELPTESDHQQLIGQIESASDLVEEAAQLVEAKEPLGEADDDSIAQYMAGLLARAQGEVSGNVEPQPDPQQPVAVAPIKRESKQKPPREYRKASPAVSPQDLENLRELANTNARSALEEHSFQCLTSSTGSKLLVATSAVVFSIVLTQMSVSMGMLFYYFGLAGLCVALLWGCRFFVMSSHVAHVLKNSVETDAQSVPALDLEAEPVADQTESVGDQPEFGPPEPMSVSDETASV